MHVASKLPLPSIVSVLYLTPSNHLTSSGRLTSCLTVPPAYLQVHLAAAGGHVQCLAWLLAQFDAGGSSTSVLGSSSEVLDTAVCSTQRSSGCSSPYYWQSLAWLLKPDGSHGTPMQYAAHHRHGKFLLAMVRTWLTVREPSPSLPAFPVHHSHSVLV
jgi:hypothetical protein